MELATKSLSCGSRVEIEQREDATAIGSGAMVDAKNTMDSERLGHLQ